MTGIDYFAWFVLVVIIISVVWLFVMLAALPGRLAAQREHPQADAIKMAGWLGALLTFGVVWALGMVWAVMQRPLLDGGSDSAPAEDGGPLGHRLAELEARLERLEANR